MCFFIKLGIHVSHSERMNPIDFRGHRSKVKVTIEMYGNKLVNTIGTKPLCASSSNLANMLTMVRGWTLLILEVTCQRWRPRWASFTNVGCAGMLRFALLYLFQQHLFAYDRVRIRILVTRSWHFTLKPKNDSLCLFILIAKGGAGLIIFSWPKLWNKSYTQV